MMSAEVIVRFRQFFGVVHLYLLLILTFELNLCSCRVYLQFFPHTIPHNLITMTFYASNNFMATEEKRQYLFLYSIFFNFEGIFIK